MAYNTREVSQIKTLMALLSCGEIRTFEYDDTPFKSPYFNYLILRACSIINIAWRLIIIIIIINHENIA